MPDISDETLLMLQHQAIKKKYPDAIILLHVGHSYEVYGEDAVIASKILGITLAKKSSETADLIDLARFPDYDKDANLGKLVKAGYRVAHCDKLEVSKASQRISLEQAEQKNQPKSRFSEFLRKLDEKLPTIILFVTILLLLFYIVAAFILLPKVMNH